jgi:hypothetical protein
MRKTLGAALVVLVVAVAPAWAQTSVFLGRATPTQIVNVPIDTSQAIAPIPQQSTGFGLMNIGSHLHLNSLFSNFHFPGFPPTIGQSPLPPPSSFPSTHYQNAFKPVQPIVPKQ